MTVRVYDKPSEKARLGRRNMIVHLRDDTRKVRDAEAASRCGVQLIKQGVCYIGAFSASLKPKRIYVTRSERRVNCRQCRKMMLPDA